MYASSEQERETCAGKEEVKKEEAEAAVPLRNNDGCNNMQSRRSSSSSSTLRRPRLPRRSPTRLLSFRTFVWLVLLLLVLLVISPQLYFYTKLLLSQGKKQECEWLNHPPLVCAHAGDTSQAPPNTVCSTSPPSSLSVNLKSHFI